MKTILCAACVLAALAVSTAATLSPAFAAGLTETTVNFSTPPVPPSPFKLKRAKAKGIELEPTPGTPLSGMLFRPNGEGPFPALVLLVGGNGVRASHHDWARTAAEWGYAALLVDSFVSRGGTNYQDTAAVVDIEADAYGAYNFLSQREDIQGDRIGFLGFSLGSSRLFTILDPANDFRPEGFAPFASIGFYPICPSGGDISSPLLILLGDNDNQADLTSCLEFAKADPEAREITVYPGLTHYFDNPEYGPEYVREKSTDPAWYADLLYDAEAHRDSLSRVRAFLEAN